MIPTRGTIGGSQIAAILGLSPYSGPLEVYAQVVGDAQPAAQTEDQARGHWIEGPLLQWWAEAHGAALQAPPAELRAATPTGWGLRHPTKPYLRATLDALGRRDGLLVVPDAKSVNRHGAQAWGEPETDDVPFSVVLQLHVYGAVTRALGWDMAPAAELPTLLMSDRVRYVVPYDPILGEMVVAAAERFYTDHVLPRRPPPPSEPYSDLRAVDALYRRHEGAAKRWDELQTEEQRAVVAWLEANEARKAAEHAEVEAEAAVKLILGTAPQLVSLPDELGVNRIDWKANKPSQEIDWEGVAKDLYVEGNVSLGRYKEFVAGRTTKKEGARPLRAWKRKP